MSTPKNILLKIESLLPSMQPVEQRIAKFVLENAVETKFMSVSEVASIAHVSEASVIRFVKMLGVKGFSHFKLELASLSSQENFVNPTEDALNNSSSLNKYIRDALIASIHDTYSMLNRKNLESAAEAICAAEHIFCAAVGPCGTTCRLLAFYLSELGLFVHYNTDPVSQMQNLAFSTEKDVVIAVSHSGTTMDTLKALEIAHANKTKIITITHYIQSPIIELTDILLCSYARKDPKGLFNNGTSQVAQMYVIESLKAYIRLMRGEFLSEMDKDKLAASKERMFGIEDNITISPDR